MQGDKARALSLVASAEARKAKAGLRRLKDQIQATMIDLVSATLNAKRAATPSGMFDMHVKSHEGRQRDSEIFGRARADTARARRLQEALKKQLVVSSGYQPSQAAVRESMAQVRASRATAGTAGASGGRREAKGAAQKLGVADRRVPVGDVEINQAQY